MADFNDHHMPKVDLGDDVSYFKEDRVEKVVEISEREKRVDLILSSDGSQNGVAFIERKLLKTTKVETTSPENVRSLEYYNVSATGSVVNNSSSGKKQLQSNLATTIQNRDRRLKDYLN
jgi:hypothetical protein